MPEASAIVLAGGKGRRLGRNKALVPVGGVPMIERVVGTLQPLCADIVIVANELDGYSGLPARVIGDAWPGMGSLGGIYTGLQAVQHERALVVGCDMPFLNPQLLSFMIELSAAYDVLIPRFDGYLEPLHAVYSRACLGPMSAQLQAGDLRIVNVLARVRVRYLEAAELDGFDPRRLSLLNVNTPADLQRAEELAANELAR